MTHGPWFNISISSYQYRKYHWEDKTVVNSLISTMRFPILLKGHLYIDSAPERFYKRSTMNRFCIFVLSIIPVYSRYVTLSNVPEHVLTCTPYYVWTAMLVTMISSLADFSLRNVLINSYIWANEMWSLSKTMVESRLTNPYINHRYTPKDQKIQWWAQCIDLNRVSEVIINRIMLYVSFLWLAETCPYTR